MCFLLLYLYFYFQNSEIDCIEKIIRRIYQEIWIPTFVVCVDKSLVPFNRRQENPHHVFIIRKLYPHGVKVFFSFFLSFSKIFFFNFEMLLMTNTLLNRSLVIGINFSTFFCGTWNSFY